MHFVRKNSTELRAFYKKAKNTVYFFNQKVVIEKISLFASTKFYKFSDREKIMDKIAMV